MTNLSNEARLSQIEKLLETSTKMITRHDQEIADLREQTRRNAEHLAQLSEMFLESITVIRTMQDQVTEMQSQVRGIQTENQRILRHLFSENQD